MKAHALNVQTSLVIGAILLALWAVSWGMSYVDLGEWSLVVALVIAAVKAVLVALFFMELIAERPSFNFAIGASVIMIAFLISLTVADVKTRPRTGLSPPRATHPTELMP